MPRATRAIEATAMGAGRATVARSREAGWRPAVVAGAAALLVAACGGGESGNQQGAAQAPAQTAQAPAAGAATTAGEQGAAVYTRTCAACHQPNGQGLPGSFPPLDPAVVSGDKGRLIRLVLHGMQGPITVMGQRYNNIMAPWKTLPDTEIAAVLTYVRQRFGDGADAVTMDEVARERAATASRATPYSPGDLGL